MAIVCDNASNNDTMVEAIAQRCKNDGIPFDASSGRGRCFPHTAHLSALKAREYLLLARNDPDQYLTATRRSWHFFAVHKEQRDISRVCDSSTLSRARRRCSHARGRRRRFSGLYKLHFLWGGSKDREVCSRLFWAAEHGGWKRGITPALLRVGQPISRLMHPVSSTSRGYQHAATLTPGDSSAIPCPTILWPV
jgi:hypothetical protein